VDTTAVVLKVVNGDTVDIRDDVRGRLRIRLLGIDTPETVGCWVRRQPTSRSRHCLGSASRSSPTQHKVCTTDTVALAYLDKAGGWDEMDRPRGGFSALGMR
jgi:micrococcal nuclease